MCIKFNVINRMLGQCCVRIIKSSLYAFEACICKRVCMNLYTYIRVHIWVHMYICLEIKNLHRPMACIQMACHFFYKHNIKYYIKVTTRFSFFYIFCTFVRMYLRLYAYENNYSPECLSFLFLLPYRETVRRQWRTNKLKCLLTFAPFRQVASIPQ